MKRLSLCLAAVMIAALTGCEQTPASGGNTPPKLTTTDDGTTLPIDHPPVDFGTGGGAAGGGAASTLEMGTRRLSIQQAASSLPIVLGGSTWQLGTVNGFTSRAASLGAPDYISITDENFEPSPLYVKFMSDAARDGCTRAGTADAALAQNQRVLTRFAGPTDTVASKKTAIDANLRYLKLRFHGVKVADADDAPIALYRKTFDDAVKAAAGTSTPSAANVAEGWRVVCVALLTSPEYHLY